MARRRKKKSSLPLMLAAIAFVAVAATLVVFLFREEVHDPYRTVETLDVPSYLENANSLRGNVYKVEGTISNQLDWSKTKGRLFSVEIGADAGADFVAILVPTSLNSTNLQKGQRFAIEVEVGDNGILHAKSLKKT